MERSRRITILAQKHCSLGGEAAAAGGCVRRPEVRGPSWSWETAAARRSPYAVCRSSNALHHLQRGRGHLRSFSVPTVQPSAIPPHLPASAIRSGRGHRERPGRRRSRPSPRPARAARPARPHDAHPNRRVDRRPHVPPRRIHPRAARIRPAHVVTPREDTGRRPRRRHRACPGRPRRHRPGASPRKPPASPAQAKTRPGPCATCSPCWNTAGAPPSWRNRKDTLVRTGESRSLAMCRTRARQIPRSSAS